MMMINKPMFMNYFEEGNLLQHDKEKEKNKRWKPNDGESYYYICSSGVISNDTFSEGWSQDKLRRDFCNAFKTEEESKKMIEKIKIINKLRELSNIDFNDDCKEEKVSVASDINDKYLPFSIYFRSKESCENAIKAIGERDLKKYYFDIKDNQ